MTTHPDLKKAIVLAAIAKLPDHSKRQLVSTVRERRGRAEEALVASIIVQLSRRHSGRDQWRLCSVMSDVGSGSPDRQLLI